MKKIKLCPQIALCNHGKCLEFESNKSSRLFKELSYYAAFTASEFRSLKTYHTCEIGWQTKDSTIQFLAKSLQKKKNKYFNIQTKSDIIVNNSDIYYVNNTTTLIHYIDSNGQFA